MSLLRIAPHNADGHLLVVIETPKGSHNEYDFDPDRGCLKLSKALPEGVVFPYDFGFIPSTLAEDGDPRIADWNIQSSPALLQSFERKAGVRSAVGSVDRTRSRAAGKRRRGVLRQPISCGGVLVGDKEILSQSCDGVSQDLFHKIYISDCRLWL